jgi:TolA-binding protein
MLGPTIWLPLAFFPEQERERVLHVYNVLGDYVNGNKSMGDVVTVLGGDYVGRDKAGRDIIQAGGSVTIDQSQISELKDIIAELRKVQDKPELPDEQKQELEAEIQTIESQAKSPKPKIQIIKDALSSAKGIVEQASGVAVAAAPLIARIASWLSGVP